MPCPQARVYRTRETARYHPRLLLWFLLYENYLWYAAAAAPASHGICMWWPIVCRSNAFHSVWGAMHWKITISTSCNASLLNDDDIISISERLFKWFYACFFAALKNVEYFFTLNIFLKSICVRLNSTYLCLLLHRYNCHGRLSAKAGGNHEQRN